MKLYLIRHGQTEGNARKQYIGSTDQPLSMDGEKEAQEVGAFRGVRKVYVTPLCRTRQTAAICFPCARQVTVEGLREMDFGAFEGRSAEEMEQDVHYREWVDGNCVGRCPGGESMESFRDRVGGALEALLRECAARGEEEVVIVAHGGVCMAALSRFAEEKKEYFEWWAPNLGGYEAEVRFGEGGLALCGCRRFDRPPLSLKGRGLVQVYYGNGKGKTTAALGLALRAAGCGRKVVVVQFLKSEDCGELASLRKLGICVYRGKKGEGMAEGMTPEERMATRRLHEENFRRGLDKVRAGECDVLILDEAMDAYQLGLLDAGLLEEVFSMGPERPEIVITGHKPEAWILERADYVTRMMKEKHPFDEGILAREGIEY